MTFNWPAMLLLLLLVPLFAALYLILRRRRYAARYGSLGFGAGDRGKRPGLRRHVPPALFLAGLTILIVALARPQTVVSLPRVEGTLILAFDVSASMAADDLNPTRMEAAKEAAREFVQRQPSSVQIGVVAFSDSGFSVQAPTNEPEVILGTIDRLEPQRGTSLAQGIFASLNAIALSFGQPPPITSSQSPESGALGSGTLGSGTQEAASPVTFPGAVIVLLSDGENNAPPDPFEAAQTAADYGVRIFTVGIGSPAGATLNIDGFSVHTILDEATLQEVAELSGGTYTNAQDEEDLRQIYRDLDPQLVVKAEKMEVTSLFAGASILILLIGGLFSLAWFSHLP